MGGGVAKDDDGRQHIIYRLDIYHPGTNIWETNSVPHAVFALAVLMNKLIIIGGMTRKEKVINKVLELDSGKWKDFTEMPTARYFVTAASHQSVLIVIGGDNGHTALATTELLDGTTGQWFTCNDLPQPLHSLQSVILGNTLYVLAGACKGDQSHEVYAAPLDMPGHKINWQRLADIPFGGVAAVGVKNKYLMTVGGNFSNSVFTLNSTATAWTPTTTIPVKINVTAAVLDNDSRIIVIGGKIKEGRNVGYTNKVWIGSF